MFRLPARALAWGLIVLLACASALPNLLSDATLARLPGWYAANQLSLGLDLRGGSYLLLGVDVDDLLTKRNEQAAAEITAGLRQARIAHSLPEVNASGLDVAVRDAAQADAAVRIARELLLEQDNTQPAYAIDKTNGANACRFGCEVPIGTR